MADEWPICEGGRVVKQAKAIDEGYGDEKRGSRRRGKGDDGRHRNGTPGTKPGRSGRNSAGMAGSVRNSTRDKNVAVLSRNSDWDGPFRPFRPERDGINNLGQ